MTILENIKHVINDNINKGYIKFSIYPYGIAGHMASIVLRDCFGINPIIIDNYKSKNNCYGLQIYSIEEAVKIISDDILVLVATQNVEVYKSIIESLNKYPEIKWIDVFPVDVGKHSWGTLVDSYNGYYIEKIGSFCSFAEGIRFVTSHNMKGVSTSSFFDGINLDCTEFPYGLLESICARDYPDNGRVSIGNDVWIGQNAIIKSGIKIGDGVIIGAGAVVTRDIPDYAIVAGVPARIIRYRYSPAQIEKLKRIKWWDWDDELIFSRFKYFCNVDSFISKYYSEV